MALLVTIEKLTTMRAHELKPQLMSLLEDTVNAGSSIGFLRPLDSVLNEQYWDYVLEAIGSGQKILLIAQVDGCIVGSVQAEPCPKQNGRHRAEIQKLMVLTTHRRDGIARRLMDAIETELQAVGCNLLFLDTVTGSPAETVYQRLGWTKSGCIPNYAVSPDGLLESTTIFYKILDQKSQLAA